MAFGAKELVDQRRTIRNGSRRRKERRFVVYSTPPSATFDSEENALALLAGWPDLEVTEGSPHPSDGAFFAVNYDVQQRPGTRSVWDIRWIYEPFGSGGPSNENENEPGFVDVNYTTSLEFVEFYRKDAAVDSMLWPPIILAPNGSAAEIPQTPADMELVDVQGMAIDEGGRPVSHEVRKVEYVVTEVREGPIDILAPVFSFFTGSRNSQPFPPLAPNAADIGRLLYLGADSQRIADNVYRFTHRFVADEYFHMRQVCGYNDEGDPILTTFDPGGQGPQQARFVWWVQPFPRALPFAGLGIDF